MRRGIASGFNDTIIVKHQEHIDSIRNSYAYIDRIKIKRSRTDYCPVRTLALFAHNEEFSICMDEIPEFVQLIAT